MMPSTLHSTLAKQWPHPRALVADLYQMYGATRAAKVLQRQTGLQVNADTVLRYLNKRMPQ